MGSGTFDSIRYAGKRDVGRDQQVDMIRHQNEGVKGKIAQGGITSPNGFGYVSRDSRMFQPRRSRGAFIQGSIQKLELFSRGIFCGTAISGCPDLGGQGAIESPGQENGCGFRVPMGELAAIEAHITARLVACELSVAL